jgi:hypothetical protein
MPGIDPATLATQWWDVSRSTIATNSDGSGTATVGSGFGYIAVQGSAPNPNGTGNVNLTDDGTRAKPTLRNDATISRNYAEFTAASNNRLVTPTTGLIAQPFTRISLVRVRTQPASDALIYCSRNSYYVMLRIKGGAANGTLAGDAGTGVNFTASLNSWHVIIEEYNGASSSFQADSTTAVTGNPGAADMGSAGLAINVGKDLDLSYPGDFDWMACYYFTGILSTPNKDGIRTYLTDRITTPTPTPTPSVSVRRGRMGLGGLGLPGLSGGYVGGTTGMTPTPSPTPAATHNGPTPAASTTNMATGYANLISKLDALSPGGGGTITLQGPAGGSAAGAYQVGGVGTSLDLSGYSFASPVTIRAADFSDKPIFRGTNNAGGWIGVPDNVIIDGWQIEDTQATDSVQDIIYYPGGQTIVSNVFRRCYVKGTILSSSSPTYGTTSGQRFVDSRGKSNITVEYCVFHAIQTGFYVDANGGSNIFRYNSVLHWGDHAVKGGGSFNGLVIQNNLFQAPLPGYSAAPNYYNHGNAIYFAGGSSAVGTGLDVNGNFFYSVVDHSHARFLAVSWEDIIAPSVTSPSPTAWTNMQVRNNKTRGGTSNVITINGVTGTGNSVTGNDVRTCSDSVEVTIDQFGYSNTNIPHSNNSGAINASGTSVIDQSGGGNTNTVTSATISAADALEELRLWAAGGNPAGITMQTLATLGF